MRQQFNGCQRLGCARLLICVLVLGLMSACTIMPQTSLSSSQKEQSKELPGGAQLIPIDYSLFDSAIKSSRALPPPATDTKSSISDDATDQNWTYRVGPGDILSIVVWEHPQLTIPAGPTRAPVEAGNWVHEDGSIFYPYIGTINVAGQTVSEIRRVITEGLKKIIPRPQVDVSVASFRSQKVYVTGEVQTPGSISVTNIPLRLMDAVSLSGGLNEIADYRKVTVVRGDREFPIDLSQFINGGRAESNPLLSPGDLVFIPKFENNDAFLLGEVAKPGVIPLGLTGLSLTQALTEVGGVIQDSANASGIFVFRYDNNEQRLMVYQLDARRPTAFLLGTQFKLEPADVVYVTSAPAVRWRRLVGNLIPSLSALNTLLLIDARL